jgi:hypothetical protein
MALPKIDYPMYRIEIPSMKKEFQFRPFLVKEEKLLLMSKESENTADILAAIKQIINNCSLDKTLDVNKLALFDLEYIFLKLRSLSVDNVIKVTYKDNEDQKKYDFDINLDDVKMVYPENVDNNIKLSGKSGIIMKYPTAALYDDKDFLSLEKDYMFELIVRCIDSIYYEDEVYQCKDYKKQELNDFIENLNIKAFEQIQKFLLNVPKMEYVITYENSLGNERKIVLNSLNDFFTWR